MLTHILPGGSQLPFISPLLIPRKNCVAHDRAKPVFAPCVSYQLLTCSAGQAGSLGSMGLWPLTEILEQIP